MQTITTSRIFVFTVAVFLSFHPAKAQQRDSFITKITGKDTLIIQVPVVPGARLVSYTEPRFSGSLEAFGKSS